MIVTASLATCITLFFAKSFTKSEIKARQFSRYFWMACVIFFIASMVTYPKEVYEASVRGLKAWWDIVFPALLPFFIGAELLMGFGLVRFMGVLLEPVMRPLFNVPGSGSLVMAIGYTSGFPISSFVTAKLRKEGLCTRGEAERLMSFTNNASPLFMLVAVSVGMFNNPSLGILLATTHYLANLTVGLGLRAHSRKERETTPFYPSSEHLLKRAFRELKKAQAEDTRPFGKLLGDAIATSADKLLVIGGFVVIFSILISVLKEIGFMGLLISALNFLLSPFGIHPAASAALAQGLFEITLGCKAASESAAPFIQQITVTSAILAWSGLSVHAQVASMVSDTDIRMLPFLIARFFHALIAAAYTYIVVSTNLFPIHQVQPSFKPLDAALPVSWLGIFYSSLKWGTFALLSLIVVGIAFSIFRSVRLYRFKYR